MLAFQRMTRGEVLLVTDLGALRLQFREAVRLCTDYLDDPEPDAHARRTLQAVLDDGLPISDDTIRSEVLTACVDQWAMQLRDCALIN
jgi:hypothetical protein